MTTVKGTTVYGGVHHHYYTHPAPQQDELVAKQIEIIGQQEQEIQQLKAKVEQLEAQLRSGWYEVGSESRYTEMDTDTESEIDPFEGESEEDYLPEVEQPDDDDHDLGLQQEYQQALDECSRKRVEIKS